MKLLKLKQLDYDVNSRLTIYSDDIKRMENVLNINGYIASKENIVIAWERHSESYAAGWLILPDSEEELLSNLLVYLEEEKGEYV